jgi:hypothetical protein
VVVCFWTTAPFAHVVVVSLVDAGTVTTVAECAGGGVTSTTGAGSRISLDVEIHPLQSKTDPAHATIKFNLPMEVITLPPNASLSSSRNAANIFFKASGLPTRWNSAI